MVYSRALALGSFPSFCATQVAAIPGVASPGSISSTEAPGSVAQQSIQIVGRPATAAAGTVYLPVAYVAITFPAGMAAGVIES
jgi:hypothetical protein